MSAPRILDLFCGAGGCSVGYARAGFTVEGVRSPRVLQSDSARSDRGVRRVSKSQRSEDRDFLHTYVVEGLRASARPVYVGEGGRG